VRAPAKRAITPDVGGLTPLTIGGICRQFSVALRSDARISLRHDFSMSVVAPRPAPTEDARDFRDVPLAEDLPEALIDGPLPEEIEQPLLENLNRAVTALITGVPPLLLVLASWQLWHHGLQWRDIAIFFIMYVPVGFGVTVGFHRLLTHRSFETSPWMRGLLAVLGTMSIEGPVIAWVADHRKHHAYTDRHGDPHSPHVDHGVGLRGALRGLAHAHVGWLFNHTQRGARERFAPDLLADPVIMFVDRTFVLWSLVGLAIPFGLGVALGGTISAGLEGMLWGGAVRVLVLHHVTYSINSLCHFFGRRRFATDDHSMNLAWLAPLSFGEAWHNNHHAFPTSAVHGMGSGELDTSALVISALERAGLAWNVQRISPSRQAEKALSVASQAS
jgi:stearoyl-CoA desaturase (Delta-9 desaturase)